MAFIVQETSQISKDVRMDEALKNIVVVKGKFCPGARRLKGNS